MQKSLLFILLMISLSLSLHAQRPPNAGGRSQGPTILGKITGTLIDTVSEAPVEFATIVLVDSKTEKEINGTLSESDGSFKLQDVKNGTYTLQVSFLGYETRSIREVTTTLEKPDLDLGNIFLLPSGIDLDEITVTGEAALVETKIDKLVYNAEKDIATSGGDASDVLRRVPLLTVDLEGNVSLRGSSNVQILINGRPSTLFSANIGDALKTINADQIKNVEVITTPSAKYDGEGSAGIINIITKKKSAQGITGSVRGNIGNRNSSGNLSLNIVKGRFGFNSNAGTRWSWPRVGTTYFYREDGTADALRILEQSGTNTSTFRMYNGQVGAFYDFNAYNSLTSSLRFNGFGRAGDGTITGSLTDPRLGINQMFTRDNYSDNLRSGFDWTTDFKRTYKQPEKEFTFAFQVSGTNSTTENTIVQNGDNPRNEINNNDGLNLEYTLQMDYVLPISSALKMETGAKAVLRDIDSDYTFERYDPDLNEYVSLNDLTNNFFYDQDVLAGYLQFNLKIGEKYGLLGGARYERTVINGEYRQDLPGFDNQYGNILPTLIVSRTLKNFSSIKLGYTQRIQRPSLFYINPYTQNSDPNNITVGNPKLAPEIVDQLELTYNTFVKGISINLSTYYRQTSDIIEQFLDISQDDQVSTTTFLNVGRNRSIGANFFSSVTLFKIWQLRGGLNVYTYNSEGVIDGERLSNEALLWSGNLNSNIALKKGFRIEMFGFFRSPRQTLQGFNPSFSLFSIGARKEFNKRFSLGVQITQPFSDMKAFPSELRGPNFYQQSEFTIPFRSFGLTVSYNFGKLNFNQQRRRGSAIDNDDLKGGEDNNF
ncbi:TonB-dependent receptor domain-containing protein [Flavilitoribacter nigricans]|uniref:TonB-dependent receptor n=1 Tax=Flavilitoribacter nigricans (strain ATCC 23147 / DSM 23189 / NBRC 102662 / NCIMB 1420 / SS-2) TaxID=1122177 RepID=A0A2D0NF91_FLAN2|nr:TonB-dependent receptor [Flavilitoribacter nigricans]PHN07050.1 hypothetical protein CRP01_07410 [Flavilitoribacter nigricans DSM 23189 = NBRC 102662]